MKIAEILKCKSYIELFPDESKRDEVYISLMKKFHPDVCSDPLCQEASAVINSLYRKAKKVPKKNHFIYDNSLEFDYIEQSEREDGYIYFSDNSVYFILDGELENNILSALNFLTDIHPKVLKQAESFLPEIKNFRKIKDKIFLEISIENGEFPLEKALEFFGDNIDPRHCAWIISRLLGMCCFAQLGGNVWNCLCPENLLINPRNHTLRIVGGWWFASKDGYKIYGVQREIYENMALSSRIDGIARSITDLECVKAVCRKIFPKNSPEPMLEFSKNLCMGDAFREMEYWEDTIIKSFGGRYFTEMKICINDIYN